MAVPFNTKPPQALFLSRLGPGDDGAAVERARRDLQALEVACRTLAGVEPTLISRISASLPAGDDLDAPDRIADVALSLAAAYGLEAEVEVGRGWVTVFLARPEEGS